MLSCGKMHWSIETYRRLIEGMDCVLESGVPVVTYDVNLKSYILASSWIFSCQQHSDVDGPHIEL